MSNLVAEKLVRRNAELVAEVTKLREALQFYADGKHIMAESEPGPANVCPPTGHYAREALKGGSSKTITAEMVRKVREATGEGLHACLNALKKTNGDVDAAIEFFKY